jgi:hypothetical protein
MVIIDPATRPSERLEFQDPQPRHPQSGRACLRRARLRRARTPRALPGLGTRWLAWWYAAFAVYASGVALFSGPGLDHWWGTWAAGGYAVAAIVAACWPGRQGHGAALTAAMTGALATPLAWLATREPATPDVTVVVRSASLLVRHGSPYLPSAQLLHGGWLSYDPYLPVMAIFGLPHALGLPGLAGDPRPWLAAATFAVLAASFRLVRPAPRASALGLAAFATSSPVLAFPLAMGITDPPVIALTCLALALLTRPALAKAAPVVGVACAMKYTAWPAVVVFAAMLAARNGLRVALRFCAISLGTAFALVIAMAPAILKDPRDLLQNTVAYPLGLTSARSPAQSPLPGHLLATLGSAGHAAAIVSLLAAGVAIAVSLVIRPPLSPGQAATRLALGLALMFALSPATRFGYFAYPLALWEWITVSEWRPARSAGDLRLSDPLDGGERLGNARARVLGTIGQLLLRGGAVPLAEPLDAGREHFPRLRHLRAVTGLGERVAPAHEVSADHEGEFLAGVGRDDL